MASLRPSQPIFRSAFVRHQNGSDHALGRAVADRALERIRRGAYFSHEEWTSMKPEEQHMVRVMVTSAAARGDVVFSHESAAVMWGIPVVEPLSSRTHITVRPGSGLRSNGAVIRHEAPLAPAEVEEIAFVALTGLARTVVDFAATRSFLSGVCAAEYALAEGGLTRETLSAALDRRRPLRGSRRVEAVIDFASTQSASPNESLCRVRFDELGYPQPEQQREYRGVHGERFFVDFYWPEWDVIVETDGRIKYEDPRYLAGRSPQQALWDEKRREDELRAQCRRFERLVWNDAWQRAGLIAKLTRAGIPRRR